MPKPHLNNNQMQGIGNASTRHAPGPPQEQKPLSSIPPHMRSEVRATTPSTSSKGKTPVHTGLHTPGTTPRHPQPPYRPQQPQQQTSTSNQLQHQPPEQRVAFEIPNAAVAGPSRQLTKMEEDPNESFHFYSDDAFLAAVDLGEGDMVADIMADMGHPIGDDDIGRPMDDDVDAGRPIDFEEGLGGLQGDSSEHDVRQAASTTNANDDRASGTTTSAKSGRASRMNAIAAALNPGSENSATGNSGAHASPETLCIPQPRQGSSNMQFKQQPVNVKPPYHHRSDQNVNTKANSNQSAAEGSAPKRSSTPAMGGFHFPPSVNPHQHAPPITGTKRPADAIGGTAAGNPTVGLRGGRPGMGLLQAAGGREVLGCLEITEGGSLKRARR
ncbi:hypothetical protein BDQ17DRAFT_998546 [Cyathus striatus]|nr:hypothetical protein BDQ17DRAFT_998546 [Cyathus striatus]